MKTRLSLALVVCVTLLTLSLVLPGTASTSTPANATADSAPYGFRVLGQLSGLRGSSIAVQGDYAYIGTMFGLQFNVVDVSNAAHPRLVSNLQLTVPVSPDKAELAGIWDIALVGNNAYIAWGYGYSHYTYEAYGGLIRVDVSNPLSPVQKDSAYSPRNNLVEITIRNGSAYVCTSSDPGGGGAEVLQVTGLTRVVEMSCNDLSLAGNIAYLGQGDCPRYFCIGQFEIADISNPDAIQTLGRYDFGTYGPSPVNGVEQQEPYVYLAGGGSGLRVMDVSNPITPTLVMTETYTYTGLVADWDTLLVNDYLFIGGLPGLRAMDVSDPTHPVRVGFQPLTSGGVTQLAAANNHLYATYEESINGEGFTGGLLILDFVPPHIAGQVADLNGSPVPSVTLTLDTGLTTTTNISGSYSFSPLQWMTYTLTPTLPGYAFWPSSQTVALPPAAEGINFVRLAQPVWITTTPGALATLTYTDTRGLPTTLIFPGSAFSQTTTIALTPTIAYPPAHLGFTSHAFDLAAYQSGVPVNDWAFQTPVTVTIHYSADDLHIIRDEGTLALWRWDGQMWSDAAETCEPVSSYQREPDQNLLSLPICRAGYYALFGPTNSVLLPIISIFRSPLQPF